MKLSVGYITSRANHEIDWFLDSFCPQIEKTDEVEILMIDGFSDMGFRADGSRFSRVSMMPNIFSGKHRLPKDNWWSKSSSINTFLCICKHPNIILLDDRCVALPGFLKTIKENEGVITAGSYEKRVGMIVEKGIIIHGGIITGKDSRSEYTKDQPMQCGGEWLFGCCLSMPLEFSLTINGWPERCNGLSFEDVIAGLLLQNNRFPMKFDPRAKIIEDRTPEKLGTPMRRESKERHPNDTSDKAHTTLRWVRTATKSDNDYDIRELRTKIQAGEPWPIPKNPDAKDWFDQELVRNFK